MASASQQKVSRKRKHGETGEGSAAGDVRVILAEPSCSIGPAFVNFPAIRPSQNTPFVVYRRPRTTDGKTDFAQQLTLLAGETGDVEYYSTNKDVEKASVENYACQYLPAIYDPSTNSLVIHPSTPTYILAQRVKRLKHLNSVSETGTNAQSTTMLKRLAKRNELGEAFGTRKAKSRIKTEERNKVDAIAQEGGREGLMELIQEAGKGMPSAESMAAQLLATRLIPPPNLETDDVAQVYPLSVLISQPELDAISTRPISEADDGERMALLPYRSKWIEDKMRLAVHMPFGAKKEDVKILYYISCMRQFVKMRSALNNPATLHEKMNHMPKVILDALITKFTENSKGNTKPHFTTAMEHKMLAYEFALRLMIERYACEVEPIAHELKMEVSKIREVFRSLGCTIDSLTAETRDRLGMSSEEARQAKRAILQAPPVFPKPKRGAAPKR